MPTGDQLLALHAEILAAVYQKRRQLAVSVEYGLRYSRQVGQLDAGGHGVGSGA
jgi:hypothetical protein